MGDGLLDSSITAVGVQKSPLTKGLWASGLSSRLSHCVNRKELVLLEVGTGALST